MVKKPWQPLNLEELAYGWWVAADPSITATGLVFLSIGPLGVIVSSAKKIGENPTDMAGWADTFARAERLMNVSLYNEIKDHIMVGDIHVVHEAPAVGPAMRPESSILAGLAFRGAVHWAFQAMEGSPRTYTVEHPVTAHAHKALICGNGRATKQEEHEELKKLFPGIRDANMYITNEATRDALCVSLYAANREWKRLNA